MYGVFSKIDVQNLSVDLPLEKYKSNKNFRTDYEEPVKSLCCVIYLINRQND